ncbi:MAG: SCP2 sterol-binding domain-containing protein, partial [Clostridia bacterium]|nr:SCP2 sterol-binding domain-containing protein [Clostridia bacterium]
MTYEQIVELAKKSLNKTAAKEIKENTVVEFDIYGEGEGAFYVQITDGKLLVEPYEYYDRDAKIIVTGEELEKIIKGEKTPQESIGDGILMLE